MEFDEQAAALRQYYEKEMDCLENTNRFQFDLLVDRMERFLKSYRRYEEVFKKYDEFMDAFESKQDEEEEDG